jgi:hypothetical protein
VTAVTCLPKYPANYKPHAAGSQALRSRARPSPLNGRSRSIHIAGVDNLPDGDADVAAIVAGVGLRRAAQPRSSRMPAVDTRAAGGMASRLTMPASTLMHSSVCPRASERKSAAIFFRGNVLWGGPTPSCGRGHRARSLVWRGDNHAKNLTQKDVHTPDERCVACCTDRDAWSSGAGVLFNQASRPLSHVGQVSMLTLTVFWLARWRV